MNEIKRILDSLENSPVFLRMLLDEIPEQRYREVRIPGKWTIHEQVCHLVDAQQILIDRFEQFRTEKNPFIRSHSPQADRPVDIYRNMDMNKALEDFPGIRKNMLEKLRREEDSFWTLKGSHDAFEPYNTKLLLIHCLDADHTHFFSIEQLGLTKAGLESDIMVLP